MKKALTALIVLVSISVAANAQRIIGHKKDHSAMFALLNKRTRRKEGIKNHRLNMKLARQHRQHQHIKTQPLNPVPITESTNK